MSLLGSQQRNSQQGNSSKFLLNYPIRTNTQVGLTRRITRSFIPFLEIKSRNITKFNTTFPLHSKILLIFIISRFTKFESIHYSIMLSKDGKNEESSRLKARRIIVISTRSIDYQSWKRFEKTFLSKLHQPLTSTVPRIRERTPSPSGEFIQSTGKHFPR